MSAIKNKQYFTKQLLAWNLLYNHRFMPWKGEKDPYKIWLSEIILQQTRVEQGWAYYERFIKNFPTIKQLAAAPDDKVLKLWEGLGYYSRCRNLLTTARLIVEKYKGKFPDTYETIVKLKGVGPYTAAAIASFAYQLPYAVVDGNVIRVLARYFGEDRPVDDSIVKKQLSLLAQELVDKQKPGIYNQAIMDFGATICKPKNPLCPTCILQKNCEADKQAKALLWPIKSKSIQKKNRFLTYFILHWEEKICVVQRVEKDIWQHLYEFYVHETISKPIWNNNSIEKFIVSTFNIKKFTMHSSNVWHKQTLTHQYIHAMFVEVHCTTKPTIPVPHKWVTQKELNKIAFPKIITTFLKAIFA